MPHWGAANPAEKLPHWGAAIPVGNPLETLHIESWERGMRTSTASALLHIIKSLPGIWRLRREARRAETLLPEYEGALDLPGSATIFEWVRELCATPHRRPGTPEGHQAEQWVAEKLREFGVQDVHLDPIPIKVWNASHWSLDVDGTDIPAFYVINTAFSGPEGIEAPLVYVGTGTKEDFARNNVAGKIVVADVPFPKMPTGILMRLLRGYYALSDPEGAVRLGSSQYLNFVRQNFLGGVTQETAPENDDYWHAVKCGAKGICLILKDQPGNSNTHYGPYDGIMKPVPGLWIGCDDGKKLRQMAQAGKGAKLLLEGSLEDGVMHNIWGVLPGLSDETLLITTHHDSPFMGAVEDGCGVAQVLAQAKIWGSVPREKRSKTLTFIIDAGHFYGSLGAHAFAHVHKDVMDKTRLLITLEHLGGQEVEAVEQSYRLTGRTAFTVMFTTPKPEVIATVLRALKRKPPKVTAAIPSNLLGPAPTSDALGYALATDVPLISWIGCPYYLLDAHDILDKVRTEDLGPICETVSEMVKTQMAMP